MRLGLIAAVVFIVLSMGLLIGAAENEPLIDAEMQEAMETMMGPTKVTEESAWGNFITLVSAPFRYFDSLMHIAHKAFNTSIWDTGQWALVPYFLLSPIIIVLVLGLIMLLIGILRKST